MSKDPAVLFYTSDFLTGTLTMTDEQVGKYIRLLCLQHQMGRLCEEDMLYICKTHEQKIFEKFIKDKDGLYYNERLEQEILRRKKYSESRKKNVSKRYPSTYVEHMETETENITVNKYKNKKKEDILEYFELKDYPLDEAESFFNHYESQGWVTGNGVPIVNWKSKAENWHKEQTRRSNESKSGAKQYKKGEFDPEKFANLLNNPPV